MTAIVPVGEGEIRLLIGDLTVLETDAIVFYASPNLEMGSGFGTAISVRGGPTIKKELEELGPIETGEAVTTSAGKLQAEYLIHAVGPRFQEENIELKLRATMQSALARAREEGVQRIAFPPMGTGFYGISPDVSARVMIEEIRRHLEGSTPLREVTICLLDQSEFKPFQAQLQSLAVKEPIV
jgi:O-acetyl-ADP-ribose deacetylase (regulator of RNase III)